MEEVRQELDRLRRAWAAAWGRAVLGRAYLVGLALLASLALASRLFGPWPPFGALEGRVLLVLAVAAGLFFLWPVLRRLAPYVRRPAPEVLAQRLDDQQAWSDAADAALGLGRRGRLKPIEAFLAAQTTGRLRELDEKTLAPAQGLRERTRRITRWVLLGLFVFALLAPGVDGWFGPRGGGPGDNTAQAGADPEDDDGALDANRWLEEHARLYLKVPDPEQAPLGLLARLRTDRPLPVDYRTRLELLWDEGEVVIGIEDVDVPAGEEAQREYPLDLSAIEALAEFLTPGEHVAQARLVPREGPFTADLMSNEVVVVIKDGSGGGGQGESPPQPRPQPEPQPEEQAEQPRPVPEGPQEEEPPMPSGPEEIEVVDPFVRNDDTVEKEDAIVAVPDPEAGLEAPPPMPLADALRDFERILEQAMGSERIRPADRPFLLRYFEALRRNATPADER